MKIEVWRLNLEIEVLKIIWILKFWKLNLKIDVLNIGILKFKFRNWSFENYLKFAVLKIGILENYLMIEVLKIKYGNWNFEKLFKNESFEN